MFPFTLHQLRILNTVAAHQSFVKAATHLYLSQAALSKQIMILEANLGVKLINRKPDQAFLTKNGEAFLKYSERILALCEESCRFLDQNPLNHHKEFTIGIAQSISTSLVPKLLFFCSQMDSQLNINFLIDSNERLANQIITQQLDIAIANTEIYEFLNDNLKLKIEHYITDPIFFVLSPTHSFARKNNLNKTDLYTLNYISLTLTTIETRHLCQLLTFNQIDIYQFKAILQVNSIESLKTAVKLGLGATFISSLIIKEEIDSKILKVIKVHKVNINQKLYLINTVSSHNYENLSSVIEKLRKLKIDLYLKPY